MLTGVEKSVHAVAATCVDERVLPSTVTFITGALPHVRCPRARTTTVDEATNMTAFEAVAGDRSASAAPPDAAASRTELPAHDGETLIDSASTDVGFAASAEGGPDTVIATAATNTALEVSARTPRRANIGDSAGQWMQVHHSIHLFIFSNNRIYYHFGNN
jgi:hypothetical protein